MDQAGKPQAAGFLWTVPRFSLLLGLSIFLVYPKPLLGLQSFFYRDYGVLGYPVVYYFRESFWRGELPLWNPLSNCGAPFLAQWGTIVCYPLSLIFLLLPLPWSLSLFTLGHLFLAGLGMFLLARHWIKHPFAAAIAGLGYVWNGATISCLVWPNYAAALGWTPWVVLFVSRAWREGGLLICLASLAGAMQMLTGVPELVLLTWLLLLAFAVVDFIARPPCRGAVVRRLAAMISLIAALSAVQLLPFFDLLRHSQRTGAFATGKWAMPPWGWGNLLVPLFHYFYTPQGTFFQAGQEFLTSYFPGVGYLTLALLALLKSRERQTWILGTLALFCLIMALGENGVLYLWLKPLIPLLAVARYPIKFVLLCALLFPLLAGWAVASANARETPPRQLWLLGLGLTLLIILILWIARVFPLPYDRWKATLTSGLISMVFLVLTVLLFDRLRPSFRLAAWSEFALLAVLLVDLLLHAARLNPTLPAGAFTPNQVREVLNLRPEPSLAGPRVMISPRAELAFLNSAEPDPLKDFLGKRRGLWSHLNLLDSSPKVNGSSTLQIAEQKEVQALLYQSPDTEFPHLADFLAVGHVTSSNNAVQWTARNSWLPLVTAGAKPVFAGPRETLAAITSVEFNPRREVYLPLDARGSVRIDKPSEPAIRASLVQAHKIQLEIDATEPAMVVVAQSFYHPWKLEINGQPGPIWRANHAFQAFQVMPGLSRITIRYRDFNFYTGAAISALSILGVGLCCYRLRQTSARACE